MTTYEVVNIMLLGIDLILTLLIVGLQNKELRFGFLFVLVIFIPLTIQFGTELLVVNNAVSPTYAGKLDNLLVLSRGIFVATMGLALLVDSYLIILLLTFSIEKISNFYDKKNKHGDELLMEGLE